MSFVRCAVAIGIFSASYMGFAFADDKAAPPRVPPAPAMMMAPHPGGEHGPGDFIDENDTNKDGVVTLDEFKANVDKKLETHFNEMDADHVTAWSRVAKHQ